MTDDKKPHPHDLFFKRAMGNIHLVEEFIEHYLPAITQKIDPGSLQLTDGSFIDQDFNEYRTDVLYRATFQGHLGYLYFLIEAQRKADRLMPLRMLEYSLQIIRRDLANKKEAPFPLIFPCVIYNGEKPYCFTTDIFEMFQDPELARDIFLKPFHLIDLASIEEEELKQSPLFGMLALHLKNTYTRDLLGFIKRVADVLKQVESLDEIDLLEAGAYYLFQTSADGALRYDILNEFKKNLNPTTQQELMTVAEAFIQDGRKLGRQEGRKEGLEQGRLESLRNTLDRQLRRRFPTRVTAAHLHRINEADADSLAQWAENLVVADAIEEVFSGK
jgi:predicted transposase/invertase (TIGR01784 family)